MRSVILILVLFIFFAGQKLAFTQVQNVAKIGSTAISEDEFLERYELTPVFGKHKKGNEGENKLKFLYTLIAEKLWALKALEERLDTTEAMLTTFEAFQKMFVRDFVYQKEIRRSVVITEEEESEAYKRNGTKLFVNYLISTDQEEIDNLYNFLNQGIPFDTILAESPELEEQKTPIEIVYGQMDEEVEDILFNLKKGEFSKPILTPDGYYIFRIVNKVETILMNQSEQDDSYKRARQIVQARKERELFFKFYEERFRDTKVVADAKLLRSLTVQLSQVLEAKAKQRNTKQGDKIYLEPLEVKKILDYYLSDTLNSIIIKFPEDPITLRKFILMLGFDGFSITETSVNEVFSRLNKRTRSFIEQELIAREGLRKGYQNEPEVRSSLKMWFDNYLFQMLQSKFTDTVEVTEQEAYDFYKSYSKEYKFPLRMNIGEILTDSLEIVTKVLQEIDNGREFKELAKLYNKRESTKVNDGEYGLTPVTMLGELGRIASMMAIGDVYGPIKLPEGYSIIKLLDKEIEKIDDSRKQFDEMKTKIISDLKYQKVKRFLSTYTADLAIKYGIDINADVLNGIKSTMMNSFGIRYMGFGGRITAAPLLAPQEDWIDEYFQRKNQLP
ncbi:MAG TPA: peptidylprolyl isomerase [Ignavibacteriaceae bacterium]|nr:peptidylprolyl isomerase [Ignavibacteriaceae bacterium]